MKKIRVKYTIAIILCLAMLLSVVQIPVTAGNLDPTSDAMSVSLEVAEEGAVLLENDGVLPLENLNDTTVAVFGRTQYDLIKGGGGSGIVNTNVSYNFVEGMKAAGIKYDQALYEVYSEWCVNNPIDSGSLGMGAGASNVEMPIDDLDIPAIADRTDVAIVIFGRNSSEGKDRNCIVGDWYLQEEEEAILEAVSAEYEDVIVILNTGGMLDMSWVETYDISAVLHAWQPGSYGSISIGKILTGEVTPSGKMMDTWAYNYTDYPASKYGTYGADAEDLDGNDKVDPVYGEDIYVGYRYFETFDPSAVRYEFGYGLSYTSFDYSIIDQTVTSDEISVTVEVENTGEYDGKEVIQLYYSAPQGLLGKAAYEMSAYAKTELLAPGEKDTLTLTFSTEDMASYDDSGVTGYESCYVMEAGEYKIYAGTSVRDIKSVATYNVDKLTVIEELTEILAPTEEFDIITTGDKNGDSYEIETIAVSNRAEDNNVEDKWDTDLATIELTGEDQGIKLGNVVNGSNTMEEFMSQFTLTELVQVFGGVYGQRTENNHYFPEAAYGAAGGMGQTLSDYGIQFAVLADGPAGVRLTMSEDDTGNTAFPIATMQSCTWNEELLERMGIEIGKEAAYNDVHVWLAPAVNIHRDPLCGRNFEYFSEDPVLAGKGAAAIVKGVQSQGVGVSPKHYALNSQETNRSGSDSIVSERAIREVYLKSFEILVKESDPWFIMTAYNMINGSYTATNYELNTTILRDEWGFTGTVMTDWSSGKDNGNASMIRAQQDLCMPSLTGRTDAALPDGFTSEGATAGMGGTNHSGQVYCTYCGTTYGDYSLYLINNLYLPADGPCTDENGNVVEDCDRPYEEFETPTLPDNYTYDSEYVYDEDGNIVVSYNDWIFDQTGLITGIVSGDVTLGELQRSAVNIFNAFIRIGCYDEMEIEATVSLDKSELTIEEGETASLVATVNPDNADETLTWSSSDSNVVAVNQNGEVTAVSAGKATITVTLSNGNSAACTVTVTELSTSSGGTSSGGTSSGDTSSYSVNSGSSDMTSTPQTGDVSLLFISVVLLGFTAVAFIAHKRKKS